MSLRRASLLLAALVAGCSGGAEPTEPQPSTSVPAAEPLALVATPERALRACREFPVLAHACPSEVPEAPFEPASDLYEAGTEAEYPNPGAWVFNLQWGGEHPGRPDLDRPPATVHVVVLAGDLPRRPVVRGAEARDGLLEDERSGYVRIGSVSWAGSSGLLLLAPPYPLGGLESNHLIYRWSQGEVDYEVSLHGWEPFTEVPPTLEAVVRSIA